MHTLTKAALATPAACAILLAGATGASADEKWTMKLTDTMGNDSGSSSTAQLSLAGDQQLAQVADVEDADRGPHGGVLLDHAGGVLQRHRPAAELGELGPEGLVPVVQGSAQLLGPGGLVGRLLVVLAHAGEVTPRARPSSGPDGPSVVSASLRA